jgi:benzoate/toluate 1,2-dioxygenase reductase subunit
MVESVRQWLKAEDITPTNFYYEKFASAVPAVAEPAAEPAAAEAAAEPAAAEPAEAAASGAYEIGEEHVSLADSDAQFDARMALELGAVELTMGRLTPEQLTEYRILAELSSATISADRFLDAAAFTDTNAAFHEYLFNCTGNEFLLEAYRRLDVKSYMSRVLRTGQWVDESVPSDHLDLVQAFERKDLSAARNIVVSHAARAKATMRSSIEQSHSG